MKDHRIFSQTMKRKLIINADDLGYTQGVNLAVRHCLDKGSLRSSTLLANGAAFEEAVLLCKQKPELGVGVHLALTEMPPLAPADKIPGLLNPEGLLPATPGKLLAALKLHKIKRDELFKELDLQVSRVVDAGLSPTHLDSHKHVHAIPEVLEVVIQIARRHSIHWIRNPFESSAGLPLLPNVDRGQWSVFVKQHMIAKWISIYRGTFLSKIRHAGLRTPDHFFGVSLTGIWNEASMTYLIERLPSGISEWMYHPGNCDDALRRQRTRLLLQREKERDLLCSPLLRDLLYKHHILLEHYGEETT